MTSNLTLTNAAVFLEWFPFITLLVSIASWFTVCVNGGRKKKKSRWRECGTSTGRHKMLLLLLLLVFTDVDEMHQHRLQVTEAGSGLHAETQLLFKVTPEGNLGSNNTSSWIQQTTFLIRLLEGVVYRSVLHSVV